MKTSIIIGLFCLPLLSFNIPAQEITSVESKKTTYSDATIISADVTTTSTKKIGRTQNLALGIGYNGLRARYAPVMHVNKTISMIITDKTTSTEKYGNTLNVGLGVGY